MPQNIAIKLDLPAGFAAPGNVGEQLHGLLFRLIADQDSSLAARLHDANASKPFTVSGLRSRKLTDERRYWVRFTALTDELGVVMLSAVGEAARSGRDLPLGEHKIRFEEFAAGELPAQLATHSVSYDQLMERAAASPRVALEFQSPTAFDFGGTNKLVPDPALCFKHYLRQWTNFDPAGRLNERVPELVKTFKEKVMLRSFVADSKTAVAKGRALPGFVGKATFQIDGVDKETRRVINALADFAFYCGTGTKTTMGMGQTIRVR